MSALEEQLRRSLQALGRQPTDPFWERFGLPHNPFPPARTVTPDLIHNQDHAAGRFARLAADLLQPQPQRRALAVVAGTGGGKTHFLQYCRRAFEKVQRGSGRAFAVVYAQAGAIRALDLIRLILDAADQACADNGQTDLVTPVVQNLAKAPTPEHLAWKSVVQDDLRNAFHNLVTSFRNEGPTRKDTGYDELRETFYRWLRGHVLTQRERQRLGTWARIATASMAIRVLRDLLGLARSVGVLEGVVLFLDEMETLFTSGLRPYQYLSFLQDLRYLFDEAIQGSSGFALLVVSACTQEGARRLRDVNYPVFERLGFKEEVRAELRSIAGVVEAREFAYTYIEHFHETWKRQHPGRTPEAPPITLISEEEIEHCYWSAAKAPSRQLGLLFGQELSGRGPEVTQASLLEELHRLAEQKWIAKAG